MKQIFSQSRPVPKPYFVRICSQTALFPLVWCFFRTFEKFGSVRDSNVRSQGNIRFVRKLELSVLRQLAVNALSGSEVMAETGLKNKKMTA